MKFVAIILSIYLLALQAVPCNDDVTTGNDSQTISVVDFDNDHDDDCELCSPFCQCHCCHVHVINFSITKFEPFQMVIPQDNFAHFDSIGKDIAFSLFQPPRV